MSPKQLKQLQDKWYAKLKDSGFSDIENNRDGSLKDWSSSVHAKKTSSTVRYVAKETYYRWAGFFLNDHSFLTKRDRVIWTMHAEGNSIRTIAKALKTSPRKDSYIEVVRTTIKKLATIMKEKYGSGSFE